MKEPDTIYDAGDMGCGELVLELKFRFAEMQGGQMMKLIAYDAGAPEDLPAWCRMTGHSLIKEAHPEYWIEKKSS